MVTKKQLAALARGRATAARNRAKNPRKCKGRGPEKKRIITCRGKRETENPKRAGESDANHARRIEAEMRLVKKRMADIASKMKKIAKPRKAASNPKRKASRGNWKLTAFSAKGKLLTLARASMSKGEAAKQAKAIVGRHLNGHRVTKVILDGPT